MRQYEIMAIIDPDVDERQIQPIIDKYSKVITAAKGTVDATDIMGRRHLAYPIKKKADGFYVVFNVTAEPATVAEMDRLMTIDEQFMRTKVMRVDDKR
ncbi:MAG: 30S ribosomal protein S6 [Propionibacteriaceae bacterium]|nr:30S ribosomal protein S6 [Propionibacteriaceae bacterium]